jgi:hypothetical protein
MPPVGFEPTIPASEWLQTYALDRAATGTGVVMYYDKELYRNVYTRIPSLPPHLEIIDTCELRGQFQDQPPIGW